jgi:hypothetical protein
MSRLTVASVFVVGSFIAACGAGSESSVRSPGLDSSSAAVRSQTGILGVVRDARSESPLGGVVIAASGHSTTTARDGTYRLSLSRGTYTVTATKIGYTTATRTVTVPSDGTVEIDWTLGEAGTGTCTYTYGPWGACQANGTQTRLVQSASPPGCTGTPVLTQACTVGGPPPGATAFRVFANNDLGMHCVDSSFAVFSILPPYNVVDAQVVALQASGNPIVLDQTAVDVRYSAIADATGSINSTSIGKTDFWQFVLPLYGAALAPGQGLQGMWMPRDSPNPAGTTLLWDVAVGLFKAPGVPIFPLDDAGRANRYPLMRFSAYDKGGTLLGSTDVVLPVSEETTCQTCHATGRVAAPVGALTWSTDADLEAQSRRNVLTLHNARIGTNLQPPVLCAACHYSPALDLGGTGPGPGQTGQPTMSSVMHAFHSDKMGVFADAPVPVGGTPPAPTLQACYQCHPGTTTQCLRGAMTLTVDCQNCHGNMAAVGGRFPLRSGGSIDGTNDGGSRRPWLDLPRCQSCHANDAVAKTVVAGGPPLASDGLRFMNAFVTGDASASPLLATNKRFAEEPGKLFRKSKGHGGLACEACHGSTHAIWSANPNDDVAAIELQGHAGTIAECSTCHQAPPPNGLGGPHGMHPVGAAWVSAHHEDTFTSQLAACQACHGVDYRGTVLSRMFTTRTLAGRTLAAGTVVGCYTCHNGPGGG